MLEGRPRDALKPRELLGSERAALAPVAGHEVERAHAQRDRVGHDLLDGAAIRHADQDLDGTRELSLVRAPLHDPADGEAPLHGLEDAFEEAARPVGGLKGGTGLGAVDVEEMV